MPTQEQVLEALKKVKFPGLSRDIVSFGFIRDVRIEGGVVSFTVAGPTPIFEASCTYFSGLGGWR